MNRAADAAVLFATADGRPGWLMTRNKRVGRRAGGYNPHEVQYLLYVEEWNKLPKTPLEQSECIERIDRSMLPKDRQKTQTITAAGRPMIETRQDIAGVKTEFAG